MMVEAWSKPSALTSLASSLKTASASAMGVLVAISEPMLSLPSFHTTNWFTFRVVQK